MTRRRSGPWLGLVVAAAVLVSACTATPASDPEDEADSTGPEPKITVAGDSISVGLGASLRAVAGDEVVVKVIGVEGTGLAVLPGFDWPTRIEELARDFPPSVLVFSVGTNDHTDLLAADGSVVAPLGTPEWDVEYSARLGRVFDAFAGTATEIWWVGHLCVADEAVCATNRHIHRLAGVEAAARPWVQTLDLQAVLDLPPGPALDCLTADGFHVGVDCLDRAAAVLAARPLPSV